MAIQSINPATEEVLASFDEFSREQVEECLANAHAAAKRWSRTSLAERARFMRQVAAGLRSHKARYSKLMTLEMGKPISEAEAEIDKCAWCCDFYAESGERFLADEPVQTNARCSYVAFQPLGTVLAIMPWNFPFWQLFRCAAPALMAGNSVLLKHASNVPQCALAIEQSFRDADFPPGVFQSLLVAGGAVEPLIADHRVQAVSLTGSSATGSQVAGAAGRALKKTVLELGGSDPFIVLADADLAAAAATAVRARFQNTGQSCIAAKRFIVMDEVADQFEERFVAEASKLKVGDPLQRDTRVGPLARSDLRDALEQQVEASVQQGAHVLLGGQRLAGRGYFYAPTVMSHITPDMRVFKEETFGPVAALIRARDVDEAIELANQSMYGLGANLWTQDVENARQLARRIESGSVFINGMVASDPRLPFGGIKQSGFGRELSVFGIREFVNVQTVWVGPATAPQMPTPAE
jgi:acyl-CoA reductase-like NAD-dependent aldehyde dehydrogenase